MRTPYYYISCLALVAIALSCSVEEADFSGVAPGEKIVFKAKNGDNSITRTILHQDGSVWWNPGESIDLFYGASARSRFVSTNTEPAAAADFTGSLDDFHWNDTDFFWAVYPYSAGNSCDGGSVTVSLPASQAAVAGSFAKDLFISVARTRSTDLEFRNVCGGVKFSVGDSNVKEVRFEGNGGEPLAGKVRVAMDDGGIPRIAEVLEPETVITLSAPDGGCFVPGENYYIVALPCALSSGFTMTFIMDDQRIGTFRRESAVELKRSIFGTLREADGKIGSWETVSGGTDVGTLYLGIMGFNEDLYPYSLRKLSPETRDGYDEFIDALTMKGATILCYAVDETLSGLGESVFPEDLSTVAVVTFTDGRDQGSLAFSDVYDTRNEYLDALRGRIRTETVADLPLTAYSIGLRGTDVQSGEIADFKNDLKRLASSDANAYFVENMDEVNERFQQIAEELSRTSNVQSLTLRIPVPSSGTRIRFTLDNVSSVSSSGLYIEGVYDKSTSSLNELTYGGITCGVTSVTGTVSRPYVTFTFTDLHKNDNTLFTLDYVKEWLKESGSSSWKINSEFTPNDLSHDIRREFKSAAIMLVLDCSTSLGSDFNVMRQHAKSFITTLCNGTIDPLAVSAVELSRTELSLERGTSATLVATVLPATAALKTVTWSSDNPSVASVDGNGTVTGVSLGTATVTVTTTDGGRTASCLVTVGQSVTGIVLDHDEYELYTGEEVSLVATSLPEDASNKAVEWSSSNPSVATVDGEGKVTAVKAGITDIVATAADGSGISATCGLTVLQHVTGIRLGAGEMSLSGGQSGQLSATVLPADASDKSVLWSSDDEAVASVSETGLVTGHLTGMTTVRVRTSDGGYEASCTVLVSASTVIEAVDLGLSVKWGSANVGASSPEDYGSYFAWGETAPKFSYSWDNYKYGTSEVLTRYNSSDGLGTLVSSDDAAAALLGGGWRMPTASECSELLDGAKCTWEWTARSGVNGYLVTSLINGNSIFLPAAGSRRGEELLKDGVDGYYWASTVHSNLSDADDIKFYSDAPLQFGANSRDKGNSVRPVMEIPVQSISLDRSSLTLWNGESATLVLTVTPSNATHQEVSWSSSNSQVASVDGSGKVTALKSGTANVTVTCGGKSKTCAVTVRQHVTGVSLSYSDFGIYIGSTRQLSATVSPSDASDKSLTWTSSAPGVATVSSSGLVTPVSPGTATITAESIDGGLTASCEVTVLQYVTSIVLDRTSATIYTGETLTLNATVLPETASDKTISWTSTNTSVATVSSDGVVTPKKAGTATIKATSTDGSSLSASCSLTVKQHVTGVTLNASTASVRPGQTVRLTATCTPFDASDKTVVWSSSNNAVATVSTAGVVTGVALGSAVITATSNDGGHAATCTVSVSLSTSPSTGALAVTKNGTRYYVSQSEYSSLDMTGYTKEGVALQANGSWFLVKLKDSTISRRVASSAGTARVSTVHYTYVTSYLLTFSEANNGVRIMPSSTQATAIVSNMSTLNSALSAFGGTQFSTSNTYWTSYNTTRAYYYYHPTSGVQYDSSANAANTTRYAREVVNL